MIVHLVASAENITEDIHSLRKIVSAIHAEGHTLAADWVEPAYSRASKDIKRNTIDWQLVYRENMEAIRRADVIVADSTLRSFGTGYQIAIASQLKKPIILLRHENAENDIMAAGVAEGSIQLKLYNDTNVEDLVKDFLIENDIQTKDMRFNFFIDRQIYNYLRWASFKTSKTKAEILRELVLKEIRKEDI